MNNTNELKTIRKKWTCVDCMHKSNFKAVVTIEKEKKSFHSKVKRSCNICEKDCTLIELE